MVAGLIFAGDTSGLEIRFHEMFKLIIFSWKDQVTQPLKQAVFFKKNTVKFIKVLKQLLLVFEEMSSCGHFFIGIEMFDDSGRISR